MTRAKKSLLVKTTQAVSHARRQFDWQRALKLFTEYTQAMKASGDYFMEMPLINTTITACEVGSCWPMALDLARQAQQYQLQPTVFTLTALMSACRQGRQWQKALDLFASADAVDAGLLGIAITCAATGHLWTFALDILASADDRSVAPNSAVQNAAILACEKGRQWELAVALFAQMNSQNSRISMTTVNSVLSACEKARQWRPALCLLADLPSFQLQPNIISLNLAIGAFAASRNWVTALQHFQDLCRLGDASHTSHTTTLSSCERAMRWEDALHLVLSWPFNRQSSEVAAIAAARARRWEEALQLVQGHFGRQQLVQSCEQCGYWGRCAGLENSAHLVEKLQRWQVALPDVEAGEVSLRGVGHHLAILVHPGTAPSNAVWCLTARDSLEGISAMAPDSQWKNRSRT